MKSHGLRAGSYFLKWDRLEGYSAEKAVRSTYSTKSNLELGLTRGRYQRADSDGLNGTTRGQGLGQDYEITD
jgi:hypothetical protein